MVKIGTINSNTALQFYLEVVKNDINCDEFGMSLGKWSGISVVLSLVASGQQLDRVKSFSNLILSKEISIQH